MPYSDTPVKKLSNPCCCAQGGDFSMANLLFDLMQKRKVNLPRRVIDMYFRGLKVRRKPYNTKTSVH